jgi:hypothetical protein
VKVVIPILMATIRIAVGQFLGPTSWHHYVNNPVIQSDPAHEGQSLSSGVQTSNCYGPEIVFDEKSVDPLKLYKMWYFCGIGPGTGTVAPSAQGEDQIFYATSPNGLDWTKQGTGPVLDPPACGTLGGCHSLWGDPTVVWDPYGGVLTHRYQTGKDIPVWSGQWVMFYTAGRMLVDAERTLLKLNSANQPYHPSGPLHSGEKVITDTAGAKWVADSIVQNGLIQPLFTDGICRATSLDGLNWTPYSKGLNSEFPGDGYPVISPLIHNSCFVVRNTLDGGFENSEVARPSVILEKGTWRMWYDASQDGPNPRRTLPVHTMYRESKNGIDWGAPTTVKFENLPTAETAPSGLPIPAQYISDLMLADIDVEKIGKRYVMVTDYWYPGKSMPPRYLVSDSAAGPFRYVGELFSINNMVPGGGTTVGPHNLAITAAGKNRFLVSYGTMINGSDYFTNFTSGVGITEGFWTTAPNILTPLLLK